jgi:two-component system, sensor histidine kinase LadS
VPIYLLDQDQLKQKNNAFGYSSGFIYGYLFALIAFNAMLYFGLRDFHYLLYALYLSAFILMNLSYNGHGFMWLWPNSVMLQKFGQPFFMMLFGNTGIIFPLYFLDIRKYSIPVFRAAIIFVSGTLLMLLIAVLIDHQQMALLTAFVYTVIFITVMITLGIKSLLMGNPDARYFLPAVLMGMMGAGFTALSVWGIIIFTPWTYRAVEIGMLLESTLLALALAFRFRRVEEEHLKAHRLSLVDPLTNLYNRRAFANNADDAWSSMVRHQRVLCVIMLDIDHFKNINDEYGHDCGDAVLSAVGKVLLASTRQEDTAARWGGEEFILLLPETELTQARIFAERLREEIDALVVNHSAASVDITASFGVASSQDGAESIESVIQLADSALYEAKTTGKNRVIVYSEGQKDSS